MGRKSVLKLHLAGTILAVLTISTYFFSSLTAEVIGNEYIIKVVKAGIFYSLPVLIIVMPILAISGNKLAGNSKNKVIQQKKRRMKVIMGNGFLLVSLAVYLYYHVSFKSINFLFYLLQIVELSLGLANLVLMVLNIRSGFMLSGRFSGKRVIKV